MPVVQYSLYDECEGTEETVWKSLIPTKSGYSLPKHEYEKRQIYSAIIPGLQPKQDYILKISEPSWSGASDIYRYSNFDPKRMTIVLGGDIGNNKVVSEMSRNTVVPAKPDLIVLGGDIAYDNNVPE